MSTQIGLTYSTLKFLRDQPSSSGYDIFKGLQLIGMQAATAPGIYKTLTKLAESGAVEAHTDTAQKRKRMLYCLTETGRRMLLSCVTENWNMLFAFFVEYLLENCLPLLGLERFANQATAYVSCYHPTSGDYAVLRMLKEKVRPRKLYYVSPCAKKLGFEEVIPAEGDFSYIPLKHNYLGLLFLLDVSRALQLSTAISESHRVLRDGGTLLVVETLSERTQSLFSSCMLNLVKETLGFRADFVSENLMTREIREYFGTCRVSNLYESLVIEAKKSPQS
jgi:DNA-binding PadR family transcriptional regulator